MNKFVQKQYLNCDIQHHYCTFSAFPLKFVYVFAHQCHLNGTMQYSDTIRQTRRELTQKEGKSAVCVWTRRGLENSSFFVLGADVCELSLWSSGRS